MSEPAPQNKLVRWIDHRLPIFTFVSDTVVRIGENPQGSNFDLNSVEQL